MRLQICIPAYDGKIAMETVASIEVDMRALRDAGHEVNMRWKSGCSLIHVARNDIATLALNDGVDAIVWVDADLAWEAGALPRLVGHGVDMVGIACLQKVLGQRNWNITAVEDGIWPKRDPANGLVEVRSVGTGLLFTRRAVYERLKEQAGAGGPFDYAPGLGEDASFCKRWRDVGGKVWIDPDVVTAHIAAPGHQHVGRFADDLR